jgi:hypothetical protein
MTTESLPAALKEFLQQNSYTEMEYYTRLLNRPAVLVQQQQQQLLITKKP